MSYLQDQYDGDRRETCPDCGRIVRLDAVATEPTLAFHFKPRATGDVSSEECSGSQRPAVRCTAPLLHRCGHCGAAEGAGAAGLCSACEEAELIHERAHAGIGEPDDCDRGPSCPLACRQCGEPADDGEGWDGLCGNCADRATVVEALCGRYNVATAPYVLRTDHEHYRRRQQAHAILSRLRHIGARFTETESGRLRSLEA